MTNITIPALRLEEIAQGITTRLIRAGRDVYDIGRLLSEAKELIPHGGWLTWLDEHFAMSHRTAENMMRVYRAFQGKNETVANLPVTVLYLLAGADDYVIEQVDHLTRTGNKVTARTVKNLIDTPPPVAEPELDQEQLDAQYVRSSVTATGIYSEIGLDMSTGRLTPKEARMAVDAYKSVDKSVGKALRRVVRDPAVIHEMNRLHSNKSQTYTDIIAAGGLYLPDDDQTFVPLKDITPQDLRRVLDVAYKERKAQAVAASLERGGIEPVVVTLYRNAPERTLQVLRRELSNDDLITITEELLQVYSHYVEVKAA